MPPTSPPPPLVELGSLDLFGDLYEGGHAGHNSSGEPDELPFGVLLPWSRAILAWDLICSSMLLIMCFYLPLRLSFLSEQMLQWPEDAWLLSIDVIYMMDMFVSMNTAYYDFLGNLETRRRHVIRHYLRGWFVLDLVCCFPSDWIYLLAMAVSGEPAQQYVLLGLRALRLLRTLRLLTHRRVYIYVAHLFARLKIRASWVALVKRTVFTIVFAHCNACLQFLLAVLADMPDDSWVVRAGLLGRPVTSQYFAAVFHAVSQMLAVGHGVALPERNVEYITFIISLVLGANLYAVFVGTLISVIEDANGSHREYCKRIDMLHTWMAHRQLPRHLRHKLETYYEILFPGGHAFDDEEILNSLSGPLLEEVSRHKCKSLLRELHIDARASPGLARQLSLALARSVYVSGDVIVHEGQAANGMYFIIAGRVFVHVRAMGPYPIKQLQANTGLNAIFGEMALLSPDGRAQGSISVPANAYADCFLLKREKFKEICVMYPSFKKRMEEIKRRREEEQNESMHKKEDLAPRGEWAQGALPMPLPDAQCEA